MPVFVAHKMMGEYEEDVNEVPGPSQVPNYLDESFLGIRKAIMDTFIELMVAQTHKNLQMGI